jgi:hypothetical protein
VDREVKDIVDRVLERTERMLLLKVEPSRLGGFFAGGRLRVRILEIAEDAEETSPVQRSGRRSREARCRTGFSRSTRQSPAGGASVLNSYAALSSVSEEEAADLESLIRQDFELCHPGETLDDLKRRASFSKEDRGLLRDWMAIAARRAAAERGNRTPLDSAAQSAAPFTPTCSAG